LLRAKGNRVSQISNRFPRSDDGLYVRGASFWLIYFDIEVF